MNPEDYPFKIDYNKISPDRSLVIHISTQVETLINTILKIAIGLGSEKTQSFGDTSSALSFNSKIILLLDFDAILRSDRNHFTKLSEIRNQFAHNYLVKDFMSLNNNKNGQDSIKHLEKHFAKKIDNYVRSNENLSKIFVYMTDRINEIISELLSKMESNALLVGKNIASIKKFEIMNSLLDNYEFISTFTPDQILGLQKLADRANEVFKNDFDNTDKKDILKGLKLL